VPLVAAHLDARPLPRTLVQPMSWNIAPITSVRVEAEAAVRGVAALQLPHQKPARVVVTRSLVHPVSLGGLAASLVSGPHPGHGLSAAQHHCLLHRRISQPHSGWCPLSPDRRLVLPGLPGSGHPLTVYWNSGISAAGA